MAVDFPAWAKQVRRLHAAVRALAPDAAKVGAALDEQSEWYELLAYKLAPQLSGQPLLVAAVVGGTNIGKSVVFNHLAGETASAVSPLAAGTKHPVCLTPPTFEDAGELARLFTGFELRAWQSPTDPLLDDPRHLLFWRQGANVPPRLLLLDTPDIDSDAPVNWQRADHVRQTADVLIAILTQQKYNDAAVKQFFRKAAAADKPVIVVFNQVDLEADRDYWPQWLATFTQETGARPELVYVAPHDRQASLEGRLAFHSVGADGRGQASAAGSLQHELASLHFDRIKIRTFRGAMQGVFDHERGLPAWLRQVRRESEKFSAAAASIARMKTPTVSWPTLPSRLLVEEIRQWWDGKRSRWSQGINSFYRQVGEAVLYPMRKGMELVTPPTVQRNDAFQAQERRVILQAVEDLLAELDRLASLGNETLQPRLAKLLAGDARHRLLTKVEASHAALPPVDEHYRAVLRQELDAWETANPRAVRYLRSADHVLALARPAITVTLAASGWFLAGGLVHGAAMQAVGHTASQIATEAGITGIVAGGGEVLVSTTGEGVKQVAARLLGRLQTRYTQLRAEWLAHLLEQELLGELLAELRFGAELPRRPAFGEAEAALQDLQAG